MAGHAHQTQAARLPAAALYVQYALDALERTYSTSYCCWLLVLLNTLTNMLRQVQFTDTC